MAVTQHWNDEQEQLAIQWGERAAGYMWLHNEASNEYSKLKQLIGIPTIISSTLSGAGFFSTMNSTPSLALQIIIGASNISTILLTTLNNFLKYSELMEAHRAMAKEFSTYTRAIATQLSFPTADRDPPKMFLQKYQQLFDDLIAKAPHIPDKIIDRFSKNFQDDSIAKPLIVNALTRIVAYESTSNQSTDNTTLQVPSRGTLFQRTAHRVKEINNLRKLSTEMDALERAINLDGSDSGSSSSDSEDD